MSVDGKHVKWFIDSNFNVNHRAPVSRDVNLHQCAYSYVPSCYSPILHQPRCVSVIINAIHQRLDARAAAVILLFNRCVNVQARRDVSL